MTNIIMLTLFNQTAGFNLKWKGMEIGIKDMELIINILSSIKNGEEYYISKNDTPEMEYARIKSCAKYIKENKLAKFVGIFIDGISIQIIKENGLLFLDNPPIVENGNNDAIIAKDNSPQNDYKKGIIISVSATLIAGIIIWIAKLIYNIWIQ